MNKLAKNFCYYFLFCKILISCNNVNTRSVTMSQMRPIISRVIPNAILWGSTSFMFKGYLNNSNKYNSNKYNSNNTKNLYLTIGGLISILSAIFVIRQNWSDYKVTPPDSMLGMFEFCLLPMILSGSFFMAKGNMSLGVLLLLASPILPIAAFVLYIAPNILSDLWYYGKIRL